MKLRDAETQLDLAAAHSDSEETVRSCINSMISAARSVTLVMQKESGACPALADWYHDRMSTLTSSPASELLRFFNDQRVYSIHKGVVVPEKITPVILEFKLNNVVQPPGQTMIFYRFAGTDEFLTRGSGGVFRLCIEYLSVLRGLVAEWLAKRAELLPSGL